MGLLKSCFAVNDASVEWAVLELYDESSARTGPPGFDDVLGEPYLPDSNADGLGERHRPTTQVTVKCKAKFVKHEEQKPTGGGNDSRTFLVLTLFDYDLSTRSLLTDGVYGIGDNDRLLRITDSVGRVRVEFAQGNREGLYCYEIRPGETGTGIVHALFEKRARTSAS